MITNETAPVAAAVAAVMNDQYPTMSAKTRRAETIVQPAAGDLEQGIGPDEGTEDDAHGDFVEAELLADDRRHGRDVHPIEIGDEVHQADQRQYVPPADARTC